MGSNMRSGLRRVASPADAQKGVIVYEKTMSLTICQEPDQSHVLQCYDMRNEVSGSTFCFDFSAWRIMGTKSGRFLNFIETRIMFRMFPTVYGRKIPGKGRGNRGNRRGKRAPDYAAPG